MDRLQSAIDASDRAEDSVTAWRIEGTLREFPQIPATQRLVRLSGPSRRHFRCAGRHPAWRRMAPPGSVISGSQGSGARPRRNGHRNAVTPLDTAFDACDTGEDVTLTDLAEYMGVTEKPFGTASKKLEDFG